MRSKDALIAGVVALLAFGTVFTGLSVIRGEFRDNTVDMYRDYDSGEPGGRDFALPDSGNDPAAASPAAGPEVPLADGAYVLRPAHSLKCLAGADVDGRVLLVQRTCLLGEKAPVQPETMPTIQLTETGGGNYLVQLAGAAGLCMTVDYGIGEEGRLVGQQECNPGLYHQRFILKAVKSPVAGGFQIRPEHSELCLTVPKSSTKSGVSLVQSECKKNAANQEFMVDPAIV
ncbi:RICIN domain-containing protein [Phytomonospora sp. NPDC050363]|uniref:RICIN domain-containing protein n=1 Tax=Phytomonospora sp. NPDC050363 TaxID=3155642 RepID=UPI0033D5C8D9